VHDCENAWVKDPENPHSLVPFDYFDAYFSVKALAFNTFYCKS
jgi:hypothetical protein